MIGGGVDGQGRPFYVCRPKATSRPVRFVLTAEAIEADDGLGAVRVALNDIARVRLVMRLSHFLAPCYLCDITGSRGGRLRFSNVSWTGIAGIEVQNEAYRAFLRALHTALAEAGSQAAFTRGEPPWRYWAMLVVYALPVPALGWILFHGFAQGAGTGLLATAIFLVAMLWPGALHARLNRPGRYAPEALPEELLPY